MSTQLSERSTLQICDEMLEVKYEEARAGGAGLEGYVASGFALVLAGFRN